MRLPVSAAAVALALVAGAGGCGGGERAGDDATVTTARSTSSTSAPTSATSAPAPETTTTPEVTTATTLTGDEPLDPDDPALAGEGIGDIEEFAPDLLLVGADLGASFADVGYLPGSGLCGATVDGQVPADVLVGTELDSSEPAAVVRQELRIYADDAAAGQAFAVAIGGCGDVTDRTVELGFDAFSAPFDGGQVVVVLLSDALISVAVTGDVAAVDPIRAATVAVEKVLLTSAALGGEE